MLLLFLSSYDQSPYDEDRSGTIKNDLNLIPPNKDCKAKHTYRNNETGLCACEQGYEFGDPSIMHGCWTCNNSCNENFQCVYPGYCECLPGFQEFGDKCLYISPELVSISPDTLVGKRKRFLNVTYVAGKDFRHKVGYCRFGSYTTNATISVQGNARCLIPYQKPGEINFSFSFDNETWSIDELPFNYKKAPPKIYRKISFLISYLMFFFSLYLICSEARKEVLELYENKDDDEEIMKTIPKEDIPLEEHFET
ncbi:hypothetical protein TVAG_314660 [Trichomonas vaginalis G3]|uniref:Uncharacterized protein n=1 Tax=Trichomonas vaginalis (strain ATCC PRA-98 / G3) TaxID=412133 RepID=A2ETQ5_TRIV3|nr:immunoglobulins domain-containing protein [Trichomonas vaginalis G3]EAY03936.1 hypothetical protein TVAG_314660 [Trichomonas vaginalis G3]KAI5541044.1 immunoglobulins domain-containing protein [Trichomonas vaginalis G3]|eukprot:XP_001316159.1 hypothetical protein [Trichomonas vaginalis G3]